jgi:hypothetical protein
VACLIVPTLWGMGKKFVLRHLSAYTLAFLILLIPWLFSSVNPQGMPWFFTKIQLIIHQRYTSVYPSSIQSNLDSSLPEMAMASVPMEGHPVSIVQLSSLQNWVTNGYDEETLSQSLRTTALYKKNNSGGLFFRGMYHLFHNFSTSIMSMPDSLIYNDLTHLTQPVYWVDGGDWQGNLPLTQTVLIGLNLFLIAIGLGYSWVHHRWAGMIPMVIFMAYSVSLGVAMSSGGRYLVPIDWVIYFYYGVALVAIIQFIYKVLMGKGNYQPASLVAGTAERISNRSKLGFSLAGIICLASLIPLASFFMPVVTASARNRADVESAVEKISAYERPGESTVYGEILYPYYKNGKLTFVFITPSGDASYTIDRPRGSKPELSSGEYGFIVLHSDVQEKPQVQTIYLWQDAQPVPIWNYQP